METSTLLAGRYIPEPIGLPGFDLPDISGFHRVPFAELGSIKNVTMEGATQATDSFAYIPPGFEQALPLRIRVASLTSNACILLGAGSRVFGQIRVSGPGHTVIFSGSDEAGSAHNIELNGQNNCFFLGKGSSSNGLQSHVVGENMSICVGEHLLCAHNVKILTSDMHALIDTGNHNAWINPPASVRIDPHVWLAEESTVLKGASLGFGSVLAIGAILTKAIGSRCIAAGVPARIIRENTTWLAPYKPYPAALKALAALEDRVTSRDCL